MHTRSQQNRQTFPEGNRVPGPRRQRAPVECQVFIGNLTRSASAGDVNALLRRLGFTPTWIHVPMVDGGSRGFGFADFATAREAADALVALQGFELQGRHLRTAPATRKPQSQPQGPDEET